MNNCGNKGISGKCLCDFIKMIDNRKPRPQGEVARQRRDGEGGIHALRRDDVGF